jgi:hypothetical protein
MTSHLKPRSSVVMRHLVVRFVKVQQLFDVGVGGDGRVAATGLEAQTGLARRDEVELTLQGERGRGQGEEIVEFGLRLAWCARRAHRVSPLAVELALELVQLVEAHFE